MTIKFILKNIWFVIKFIGFVIVLAICLQIFIFDSFKVPTSSMESTIVAGDYILVNKLILGARVYKSSNFMEENKVETLRLWGWRKVKRNDVLAFNDPYKEKRKLSFDLNTFYVKRCVAIPGDTFCIENGIYKVKKCQDSLGLYSQQIRVSELNSVELGKAFRCFPKVKGYNWNMKKFGPLYVPKKGDRIIIDSINIHLYWNLIAYENDKEISIQGDTILLGDEILKEYIFLKNYYFMAGDYVLDSRDSRYWGLLPEEHIIGKAAIIWKSEDLNTGKYRWERFLKSIN